MVDYYKILDVPITAQIEEIKVAIKDKRRLWMQKTNAPQLERRQEAEMKVKQIDEAEKILYDSSKRSEYDKQLKTTSTKDERTVDDSELKGGENLVKQGWDLLINDKIADAIYIATKATERDGSNPEAWALLAQAKFRWNEIEDSIYEYKKAIKLKPNEPDYYFELGGVYESEQRWQEAIDNYLKASKISPSTSMYRAAIGQVYLRLAMYNDAIPILEAIVKEEPQNKTYNWFLAMAYNDLLVKSIGKPTTQEEAERCIKYLNLALALQHDDTELKALLNKNLLLANWSLEKHWGRDIGETIKWGVGLVIAVIICLSIGKIALILISMAALGLWILTGYKKGYVINKEAIDLINRLNL